jgi:cell division septation protein DedD
MPGPNPRARAREKFELSLDGRQVASIVVGALVVLGVVFVLGLNVGRQVEARQAEGARAGDLAALDRAPAAAPGKPEPLTFHERLTRETPAPPPEPAAPPGAKPSAPPAAPAPSPPPAAAAPPTPSTPAAPPATAPLPPAPQPPRLGAWTIQLAAAENRADAERVAARFASLNPRIEEADVPGKGRFFRVRLGSFESKEEAQRYLKDVARETGAKGIVTPAR